MNRRRVTVLGLGIVLLAIVVELVSAWKDDGPKVRGLPIRKWVRTARAGELGPIAEAGTNAIPRLVQLLGARDVIPWSWKKSLVPAWEKLPRPIQHIVGTPFPATEVRRRALEALGGFGPEAASALPAVLQVATNDILLGTRHYALQAAVQIDGDNPDVLALLRHDLSSKDSNARGHALFALHVAGICPPSLTNCFVLDPQGGLLVPVELEVLGGLGQDIAPFVPRIVPFLAADSTRRYALIALQRAGPCAAPAVPALIACLHSPREEIRSQAAAVLMDIGPPAQEAVPALEAATWDKVVVPRVMAATARWRITGDPAWSAPVILAELQTWDDGSLLLWPQRTLYQDSFALNARQTALWFAGELGPAAREALPVLLKQMETGIERNRAVAARAVWKVEGVPDRSLPVLKACLASEEEEARILACYILGEIGSPAAALIPELERAKLTTLATRRAAIKAIKAIQQKPEVPLAR